MRRGLAEECPSTEAALSVDEAYVVLEPYFLAAKEVFEEWDRANHPDDPKIVRVHLEVAPWVHDSPRHFGSTTADGRIVVVAPEMAELPEETVIAILSHEFGHSLDFLYPGHFIWVDEAIRHSALPMAANETLRSDKRYRQALVARTKQWEARDDDLVEQSADGIAQLVTGRFIGYQGPCLLQCFDRGVKRPVGLR